MNAFVDFLTNPYFLTAIFAWFLAQILKLIIHTIIYKKFDVARFVGDGGMPSGHSATVASLATACGMSFGFGSFEFAVSLVLAIIVCHDAMGVRRETGKQAILLNDIVEAFNGLAEEKLPEIKLKEFVGHTPIQVFLGILLGVITAIVMFNILF